MLGGGGFVSSYIMPPADFDANDLIAGPNITIIVAPGPPQTATISAVPSGADTEIQYNSNGAFAGSPALTWDNANSILDVTGSYYLNGAPLPVPPSPAGMSNGLVLTTDSSAPGGMAWLPNTPGTGGPGGQEREVPAGAIDGVNVTFTLSQQPISQSVLVALNGVVQLPGTDYTLSNAVITFAVPPQPGDWLEVWYAVPVSGGGGTGQGQTPWEQDIDGANFQLNSVASIGINGVVTSSPVLTNLYINSAFSAGMVIQNTDPADNGWMLVANDLGDGLSIGMAGSTAAAPLTGMAFISSPSSLIIGAGMAGEIVWITPAMAGAAVPGAVGLSNPSPAWKLDVAGDVNITDPGGAGFAFRYNGVAIPTGNAVTSVFGRTGAVVAQTGDYSAAQVLNAVDSTLSYANPPWITQLAWSKISGAPAYSQTPWTSNIDAANNTLNNLFGVGIGLATSAVAADGVHIMSFAAQTYQNALSFIQGVVTANAQIRLQNDAGNSLILGQFGSAHPAWPNMAVQQWGNTPFVWVQSNAERLRMNNLGQLGLGTPAPAYPLDVAGDINVAAGSTYRVGGVPLGAAGELQTPWISNIDGAGYTLTNVQALGIATAAPAFPLDVAGDINTSGQYLVNGVPLDLGDAQTPWMQNIDGAGFSLTNVGDVDVTGNYLVNGVPMSFPPSVAGATDGEVLTVDSSAPGGMSWVAVSTGSPQTPWAQDIYAANFNLSVVGGIGIGMAAQSNIALAINMASTDNSMRATNSSALGSAAVRFSNDTGALLIVGVGGSTTSLIASRNVGWINTQNSTNLLIGSNNATTITITPTSRVGINVGNPQFGLDVYGDINITDVNNTNGFTFRINGVPMSFPPSVAGATDGEVLTVDSSAPGGMAWTTITAGGSQTPWTSNIDGAGHTLTNASQIGIGTTSPTGFLTVYGGTLGPATGDTINLLSLNSSVSNASELRIFQLRYSDGGDWGTATTRIQNILDGNAQAYIDFNPPGVQWGMALGTSGFGTCVCVSNNNGNVGIGSGNPQATLDINDLKANDTPGTFLKQAYSFGGTPLFGWRMDGGNNNLSLDANWGSWFSAMSIRRSDGHVGIGVTNPGVPLEIRPIVQPTSAGLTNQIVIHESGGNPAYGLALGFLAPVDWSGSIQAINNSAPGWLLLNPNGGNIGVATVTPYAQLDVNGAIRTISGQGRMAAGAGLQLYYDGNGHVDSLAVGVSWQPLWVDSGGLYINAQTGSAVGICTTAPVTTLDVSGSFHASGTAIVGSVGGPDCMDLQHYMAGAWGLSTWGSNMYWSGASFVLRNGGYPGIQAGCSVLNDGQGSFGINYLPIGGGGLQLLFGTRYLGGWGYTTISAGGGAVIDNELQYPGQWYTWMQGPPWQFFFRIRCPDGVFRSGYFNIA